MKKLQEFINFLDLQKPVELTMTDKNPKKWDAFYLPKYGKKRLKKHYITISTKADRNQETLLMHELIHAWQEEKGLREVHGKKFRKMARKAERVYNLVDVFVKGLDV